ncbi:hypothetical protein COU78_06175 [Candidatus Peregrinibacteria bacterium CG10_big_fil_rev_8_21_14_0_10_49_24]|nr:MAG: hypothetical protein COV83_03010 [Candidatus Peregrinibacteria bacterium CG11_big_fil_rev_8_21_14_0_20_49_14]PIR50442.1 MAG: hypothetical protein COU78_06175 [Candidatus Peregrinibacteria bacterium CG10_big_fil_rev_8_21_14_0_10_49_24]PJA68278.1 MAG: hypothetical protein CO157_00165 [Candidatus Peregrinibacteria bacterium CG_4_9_14_3_um_filter_49_12]
MSRWRLTRYHRFMQFPNLPLVVLDTETTGLVPRVNKIIEFACVRLRNGAVEEEYEQLISVEVAIPPQVEVLTRIKNADLEGKPIFDDVRDEIVRRIGEDTIIVGQNIPYDMAMLKAEGIDLSDRPWIDTSMLASLVFPNLESYSLGYVSTVLRLNHAPVHRALGDVHATMELLGSCWERLLELPDDMRKQAQNLMQKAPEGYGRFFDALPASTNKKAPVWLTVTKRDAGEAKADIFGIALTKPEGAVTLIEEPPAPGVLEEIITTAAADSTTVHWIAVKNLEATCKRLILPDGVRVLSPPFLLPDPDSQDALLAQESLTADEATLALKLLWYSPSMQSDFPLHGDEISVWNGKIACTEESPAYIRQFENLPSVILLDHRQLLSFVADPAHTAHGALSEDAHIIIDDASMLEDTATKAYGWQCAVPYLRAAAEGNEALTKLADITALWAERTRNGQDIRYLAVSDLRNPDVQGMCAILEEALANTALPKLALRQLSHLLQILQPENLHDRIAYIEMRYNGELHIQSVPERIGSFLQQHLYGTYPTSLLIPPGSAQSLAEILPVGTATTLYSDIVADIPFALSYPEDCQLESLLQNPSEGKSILLLGSKRSIDGAYIQHAEEMEQRGITLICQGLCGGAGRMRANFIASENTTLWLLTPWAYEGVSLPEGEADRLIIFSLPFDHPSHAVLSRRAEHYQNAFEQYSMARLLHRLFRLLRTFSTQCSKGASVQIMDDRLRTKGYGKYILSFLSQFVVEHTTENAKEVPGQPSLFS